MAQHTRTMYDDCVLCEQQLENKRFVDYTFDPVGNRANQGCLEPGGAPAASYNAASVVPGRGSQVYLEGLLRGQFNDDNCDYYNRDRVNTSISAYEKKLVPPTFCNPNFEPIHTRLGCPAEFEYKRIIQLDNVPTHPWQRSLPAKVNTRQLSRDCYRELNPFSNNTCGNTNLK